jgi:vacuolar protein sorting-associated protein 35
MLVGTNLLRLAQLNGVDLATYQETVLPRVIEQIVNCKDTIAQQYLMDCIIQAFPDEFHLGTLSVLLAASGQLQPSVDQNKIVIALMDRLSAFAAHSPDAVPAELEMFPLFHKHCSQLIKSKESMPLEDVLSLQVALSTFATKVYPANLSYVNSVLEFTAQALAPRASRFDLLFFSSQNWSRLHFGVVHLVPLSCVLSSTA